MSAWRISGVGPLPARVYAPWVGFLVGSVVKLALVFASVGIFLAAWFLV